MLLDFAATSVVSAATAICYLTGKMALPFPVVIGSLLILVILTLTGLSGARVALAVLILYVSPTSWLGDQGY